MRLVLIALLLSGCSLTLKRESSESDLAAIVAEHHRVLELLVKDHNQRAKAK